MRINVDETKVKRLMTRIEKAIQKHQAMLLAIEDLGDKPMAYPIHKEARGHYFLLRLLSQGGLVDEIENYLRISSEVLRYLTIRVACNIDPDERKKEYSQVEEKEAATA